MRFWLPLSLVAGMDWWRSSRIDVVQGRRRQLRVLFHKCREGSWCLILKVHRLICFNVYSQTQDMLSLNRAGRGEAFAFGFLDFSWDPAGHKQSDRVGVDITCRQQHEACVAYTLSASDYSLGSDDWCFQQPPFMHAQCESVHKTQQ